MMKGVSSISARLFIMAKLSIIIPIHNSEKTILRCLNSVVKQTMKDIEIICIDDNSKDNSSKIVEKLCAFDNRIRLVKNHQNIGASESRRRGVNESKSKYICFVDSDDEINIDYCKKMYEAIVNTNADLVECNYSINKNGVIIHKSLERKKNYYRKDDFVKTVFCDNLIKGKESVVMWNKIYKKELIDKAIKYKGANVLEDYLFNLQYFPFVNLYVFIDESLYLYYIYSNSLSRTLDPLTYHELLRIQRIKEKYLMDLGLFNKSIRRESAIWFCKYVYSFLNNNDLVLRHKQITKKIIRNSYMHKFATISHHSIFDILLMYKMYSMAEIILFLNVPLNKFKKTIKRMIY